jgi:predicted P-loop ATPase
MEIWKTIKGFENYQISNLGSVINVKSKRILKHSTLRGYKNVILSNNSFKKKFSVHRLVAMHFIENTQNKPCVNHINGIKDDNRLKNLEWCTYSENEIHSYRNLGKINGGIKKRKIELNQIKVIKKMYNDGISQRKIAKIYNVCQDTIYKIVNCKSYVKHI